MNKLPRYFKRLTLFAGLLILLSCHTGGPQKVVYKAQALKAPVATLQLGPSVFVPQIILRQLHISEGTPVRVTVNRKSEELRIYRLIRPRAGFALHRKYRQQFAVELGKTYSLILQKIPAGQARLKAKPVRFWVENYHGDTALWKRVAIGAPHGDCDLETGAVVHYLQKEFHVPATTAYGGRLSYHGIWYDVNRPLMKLPKKGGGVIPERVWNAKAEKVYRTYQDSVWRNSGLHFGQRFRFFTSFHGHDLTVKLANGKVIQRPVIEAMGIGFSKKDLRKIKRFYNSRKNDYYDNPPMLVFGNLPEDRVYYYQNIPLKFFYSGLGTRVYGSLRSDLIRYGLHIETPNSMRLDPKVQPKTARFLHDLYQFVLQEIIQPKENRPDLSKSLPPVARQIHPRMITVPGGEFLMGAPQSVGWASEHPQHAVRVSPFKIDAYEVTNGEFARFLNRWFKKGLLVVDSGLVKNARHPAEIWFRTREAAPMSEISFNGREFQVLTGREVFPVIYVSWYGANAFALAQGKRLPTEAEWEMAASYDFKTKHKYLYAYLSDKIDEKHCNFQDSHDPFEYVSGAATTPVNYYSVGSPEGVYGMSGNVMEWCSDYYQYDYYKKNKQKIWDNPQGPAKGTMRTVRGGAWNLEPWIGRTTFRLGISPKATLVNVGFRCARSLAN